MDEINSSLLSKAIFALLISILSSLAPEEKTWGSPVSVNLQPLVLAIFNLSGFETEWWAWPSYFTLINLIFPPPENKTIKRKYFKAKWKFLCCFIQVICNLFEILLDKLERLIYLCVPLLCSFRKPLKVDIFFLYIFLMKKKKSRYWSILLAICNPNSRLGTDSIIFLGLKNGKLLLVSHVQKLLQSVHDFSLNFPWIEIIRWHLFNFNSGFSFFIYLLIAFKLQTFVGWF